MKTDPQDIVYSKNVVEFVTVANEYCLAIEKASGKSIRNNLLVLQKIIPLLYLKVSVLPAFDRVQEDELEKYVSELDYNVLYQKWLQLLGEYDSFYEVFDPDIQFGEETVTASISENLLDVYQSLKDFLMAYSIGNEEVMNDALEECIMQFENYWGQRGVNVLRAIHMLLYSDTDLDAPQKNDVVEPGKGDQKWLDKFWGMDDNS